MPKQDNKSYSGKSGTLSEPDRPCYLPKSTISMIGVVFEFRMLDADVGCYDCVCGGTAGEGCADAGGDGGDCCIYLIRKGCPSSLP